MWACVGGKSHHRISPPSFPTLTMSRSGSRAASFESTSTTRAPSTRRSRRAPFLGTGARPWSKMVMGRVFFARLVSLLTPHADGQPSGWLGRGRWFCGWVGRGDGMVSVVWSTVGGFQPPLHGATARLSFLSSVIVRLRGGLRPRRRAGEPHCPHAPGGFYSSCANWGHRRVGAPTLVCVCVCVECVCVLCPERTPRVRAAERKEMWAVDFTHSLVCRFPCRAASARGLREVGGQPRPHTHTRSQHGAGRRRRRRPTQARFCDRR